MSDDSFFQLTERYPDEDSAVAYFEGKRWPHGASCVGCNSPKVYNCKANRRLPLYKCQECGKQFTVTSGTIMNNTRIPLRAWLFAYHLMGGARKGVSARQMARHLGITVKSAWHLAHRIRSTMTTDAQRFSGIVESDEAYLGGKRRSHGRGYRGNKVAVQTIIKRGKKTTRGATLGTQRGRGGLFSQAQTIVLNKDDHVDGRSVGAKLRTHTVPGKTVLMTDESPIYDKVGETFAEHHTVKHKVKEYARIADDGHFAHTNTAEGYFGNFKRQIEGTHHSVSKKHAQRYAEEHDLARLAEWHDPFATLRISKSADFMGVDPWVDFVPQTQRTRAYDLGRVRYWIELLLAEKRIPAVEIDNECNWGSYISPIPTLIDGNHRMIAHLVVGRERIMADYGGRTDVLSYLQGRRKSLPES